ncbi:BTAD domain-containing putative transcriptional regulator [Kribbella sp. NPDC056861]|uniref:BTAD domain-containing putative transcriptional regulator n=1 Tax=Kribbella sp. NPDC056861 TaxID=3154857 RepID=UPI00342E42EB
MSRITRPDSVHAPLILELKILTARHPSANLRAQLILALHRSGRQAEALAAYRAIDRLLADQLAIRPCQELQELHLSILLGEPSPARRMCERSWSVQDRGDPVRRTLAEETHR